MRVFVTGAAGFIGAAVVQELKSAGHEVLGLARNDANVATLEGAGVAVHRGDVTDPAGLAAAAKTCDGVIHLAYIHDFARFADVAAIDRAAVQAMCEVLEGTNKPLVITTGTLMAAHAPVADETVEPLDPNGPRVASETVMRSFADRGVRGSVVRLAPSVHDRERLGFVSVLMMIAQAAGVSAYVGDGASRWPAVHRLDAARLYVAALEKASPGSRLNGVGEEGVAKRAIAEAIGARFGLPVKSISPEEAPAHFAWIAPFLSLDNLASNKITRESLGWEPTGPGVLEDIHNSVS